MYLDDLLHLWESDTWPQEITVRKCMDILGITRPTAVAYIDLGESVGVFENRRGAVFFSEGAGELLQRIEVTPRRTSSESLLLALESGQFDGDFSIHDLSIFLGKDKGLILQKDISWGLAREIIERTQIGRAKGRRSLYKFLEGAREKLLP